MLLLVVLSMPEDFSIRSVNEVGRINLVAFYLLQFDYSKRARGFVLSREKSSHHGL